MYFALVKKELLTLTRDLHGLGALFVLPMVFIVVMSMALMDVYTPSSKKLSYTVINQDAGPVAKRLIELWAKDHGKALATPEDWQAQVRAGKLKYALLIDPGFSSAVNDAFTRARTEKARLRTEPGLDNGRLQTYQARLVSLVAHLRIEAIFSKLPNVKLDASALRDNDMVQVERAEAGVKPSAVQQNVPAWLAFYMVFVVAPLVGIVVA